MKNFAENCQNDWDKKNSARLMIPKVVFKHLFQIIWGIFEGDNGYKSKPEDG